MKLTRVGVDLAKQVFQVHGVDAGGTPGMVQAPEALTRWIAELDARGRTRRRDRHGSLR